MPTDPDVHKVFTLSGLTSIHKSTFTNTVHHFPFLTDRSSETRSSFEVMRWVKAKYKDETFLAQVNRQKRFPSSIHLWWLGQSGYLLQWNGVHILIDPFGQYIFYMS